MDAKQIPGWETLQEDPPKLRKEFVFNNFIEALDFVNQVGDLAESMDHHPDIFISYKKVVLTLFTHDVNGLSDKDYTLAEKINYLKTDPKTGI
ncbi:MAG: 4a-hydroxytetrahydrobiopterin dehydratase [Candidatus Daviesbacteria bacterium]|nr:4a-hydroxytetrahydrobiopterin dehydratase [Candidatus Daviesbacteria bacterium]